MYPAPQLLKQCVIVVLITHDIARAVDSEDFFLVLFISAMNEVLFEYGHIVYFVSRRKLMRVGLPSDMIPDTQNDSTRKTSGLTLSRGIEKGIFRNAFGH